jgi:hypothetical protein
MSLTHLGLATPAELLATVSRFGPVGYRQRGRQVDSNAQRQGRRAQWHAGWPCVLLRVYIRYACRYAHPACDLVGPQEG